MSRDRNALALTTVSDSKSPRPLGRVNRWFGDDRSNTLWVADFDREKKMNLGLFTGNVGHKVWSNRRCLMEGLNGQLSR